MEPLQAATLARQAADEILAELSKIGDLTARATALRVLTVRLGGLAPIEVEAWAREGGTALRDGLALAISRNMSRAESAPAMSGWEDIVGAGLQTAGTIGGAIGGRAGAAITAGVGTAQGAIGAVQGMIGQAQSIVGAVQQGGNPAAQLRASQQLLQAAQAQAQADAIIAANRALAQRPQAPAPAPAPKPRQKTAPAAPSPMQRQDTSAPTPAPAPAVTAPTTGMSPTAKTAAIVGGSAVGLGLLALLLKKAVF